jgi:hypothetical protein
MKFWVRSVKWNNYDLFFLIETKPPYSESIQVPHQQRIFRSGLRLWYIWPNLTQTSVTVVTDEWEESLQWQSTDANWINQTKLINLIWIVLGEAYFFMVRVRAWTIGWVHFIRRIYKIKWLLVSLCLSVCPSIHLSAWNNSAFTGQIFMKVVILVLFKKLSRKFKFH